MKARMNLGLPLAWGLTGLLVISCAPPRASIAYSDSQAGVQKVDTTSKLSAFSTTIHPLLTANCIGCHGHGGLAAAHSSADPAESLKVVETKRLINLADPGNSTFIQRIETGHNCGSAEDCAALKIAMIEAIQNYSQAVAKFGSAIQYKEKTLEMSSAQAQTRVPELNKGVLIVPAYLVDRGGRAEVIADGNALTGKTWTAPLPYAHPSGAARWIDTDVDNTNTKLGPGTYKLYQNLHFYGVDGKNAFYSTPLCFTVMRGNPVLSSTESFRYLKGSIFEEVTGCFEASNILPKNFFGQPGQSALASFTQDNLLAAIYSSQPNLFAPPRFDNTFNFLPNSDPISGAFKAKAAEVINGMISDKQITDIFLPELRRFLYSSGSTLKPAYSTAEGLSDLSLATASEFRSRIRLSLGAAVISDYKLNALINSTGAIQPVTINRPQLLNPAKLFVGKGALEAAPSSEFFLPTKKQLLPATGSFIFKVIEAGVYKIHFRSKVRQQGETRNLRLTAKVFNSATNSYIRNRGNNFAGNLDATGDDRTSFMWRSSAALEFNLVPGQYEIQFYERNDGLTIDEIAIVKNGTGHTLTVNNGSRENQLNEYFFSNPNPRILSYDLSAVLGKGYRFEVEIIDYSPTAYGFLKPRFVLNGKNIRVKNIGLLVNGRAGISFDSTFQSIDGVAATGAPLSYTLMTVLKDNGPGKDLFSFVFGELSLTTAAGTDFRPASPPLPQRDTCRHLDLFEKTVMPIYKEFRVAKRNDYISYMSSSPRMDTNNIQIYTCTSCHSNAHPTFDMTLEAEDFCVESIKRIDNWKQPENAKLLRGLNVSYGHDASAGALGELYILEAAELDSSKGDSDFKRVEYTDSSGNRSMIVDKHLEAQFEYFSDNPLPQRLLQTRPKRNSAGEILGFNGSILSYREEVNSSGMKTGKVIYDRPFDASFEDVPFLQRNNSYVLKQKWDLAYQRPAFLARFPRVQTVLNAGFITVNGQKFSQLIGEEKSIGYLFDPVTFCSKTFGTARYAYDASEFSAEREQMIDFCTSLRNYRNSFVTKMEARLNAYKSIVVNWIRQECLSRYPSTDCSP